MNVNYNADDAAFFSLKYKLQYSTNKTLRYTSFPMISHWALYVNKVAGLYSL